MGESFSKLRKAETTEVFEGENESNQSSRSQSLASGELNVKYIRQVEALVLVLY